MVWQASLGFSRPQASQAAGDDVLSRLATGVFAHPPTFVLWTDRFPNLAKMVASIRSVFASLPKDLAKSRPWRGLITAIGRPATLKQSHWQLRTRQSLP